MDIGASVLAKLKNKSQDSGMSFHVHLRLFCQEEFLRRLSLSNYVDNLILKGGLFIFTLSGFESRATIDIDFLLKQMPSSIKDAQKIIMIYTLSLKPLTLMDESCKRPSCRH